MTRDETNNDRSEQLEEMLDEVEDNKPGVKEIIEVTKKSKELTESSRIQSNRRRVTQSDSS